MVNDSIRVVNRALDVLQSFTFDESELSLAEICEKVDLPKTTVFRIINTLEQRRFLLFDESVGKYRLGYDAILLGALASSSNVLAKAALPYMENVSKKTELTCNLYILDGYERVCIAQVEGTNYIRRYSYLGARLPIYCGAGKLLLAFSSPSFQKEYFSNVKIERITENTILNHDELISELESIRNKGYSISIGERDKTTAAIAVPVRDFSSKVIAALTVSGPTLFFDEEHQNSFIQVLQKESSSLSRYLGYKD